MGLYWDFLTHFQYYRMDPNQAAINSTTFPENPLYTRTKAVDLMYKYMASATRELNADKYLEDPNFHDVECLATFSGSNSNPMTESGERELTLMENAVREGLKNWELAGQNLFKADITSDYSEIVPITESIQEGLRVWGPGQRGVVATKNISAYTAIGVYYGDEYLEGEFNSQFTWTTYWNQTNHPFRKKWDYAMAIDYSVWADRRLNIPWGAMVLIDSHHEYNHRKYPLEGVQQLNKKDTWTKSRIIPNFINDARESLYEPQLSEADAMRKNTEFVFCRVDGIILPFTVVHKDLMAEQQLFVYYGPGYGV